MMVSHGGMTHECESWGGVMTHECESWGGVTAKEHERYEAGEVE